MEPKLFRQTTKPSLIRFYFPHNTDHGISTCQTDVILFGNLKHMVVLHWRMLVQLSQEWKEAGDSLPIPSPPESLRLEEKLPWCLCGFQTRDQTRWSSKWTQEFLAKGLGPLARTPWRTVSYLPHMAFHSHWLPSTLYCL